MNKLYSTSDIVSNSEYFNSPSAYFNSFDSAWDEVEGQVLKIETKQVYNESGNRSYDELLKGNYDNAMQLLPEVRKEDEELYKQLSDRNVDFIRCRPVSIPFSDYLKWEMGCYDINSEYGERIYFTDNLECFSNYAHHDFMVFDRIVAAVHNYSENGVLLGGWKINDSKDIDNLIMIFSIIKATAVYYKKYISKNNVDIKL